MFIYQVINSTSNHLATQKAVHESDVQQVSSDVKLVTTHEKNEVYKFCVFKFNRNN